MRSSLAVAAMLAWLAVSEWTAQAEVPDWNVRGTGPLPWQGIASVDMTPDGRYIALGTIAPDGDPNLFLLDGAGNILQQQHIGIRFVDQVAVGEDGAFVAGLCGTPSGTANDGPMLYTFWQNGAGTAVGREVAGGFFYYREHSNHLYARLASGGASPVLAAGTEVSWVAPDSHPGRRVLRVDGSHVTALAVTPEGWAVVGTQVTLPAKGPGPANLFLFAPENNAAVWSRAANPEVAAAPAPEAEVLGPIPPVPLTRTAAALAVAFDAQQRRLAVADYQEWRQRTDRYLPARPAITVYDATGQVVRRFPPDRFAQPFWCDLTFAAGGAELLAYPHAWTSRGLGGQPVLPADQQARSLYVLNLGSGAVRRLDFPATIAGVAHSAAGHTAVACWDGRLYLLDTAWRRMPGWTDGIPLGGAAQVRISQDGQRILAAMAEGVAIVFDSAGKVAWRTDLNTAATPGEKPWTKHQRLGRIAPGIWVKSGQRTHSDFGNQYVIEAPDGLILIDPNAGLSFEQNWAQLKGAGLDPMQVKYVLLTHEHGDHAPGAYLWRLVTGAQVVASAETAYICESQLPAFSGYGFSVPNPVDIRVKADRELKLAGLSVRAVYLSGHTYGSLGYLFEKDGKRYVASGDLVMPGGNLGYMGSVNASAADTLASLRKLAALKPDVILAGHGGSVEDIARAIHTGEATGWGLIPPVKPEPRFGLTDPDMIPVAWNIGAASIAFGDLNGDGRPDVAAAVAAKTGAEVRLYLNKGGAAFSAQADQVLPVPEVQTPGRLLIRHLTDGARPALYLGGNPAAVCLLPEGAFPAFRHAPVTPADAARIFDRAGAADTAPRSWKGVNREDVVARTQRTGGGSPFWRVVDINGDGRADLLDSAGRLFLCRADGTLPAEPTLTLAGPTAGLGYWGVFAGGDFNGDGRPDVATNDGSQDLAIYYNTGRPEAPYRAALDARWAPAPGSVPPHVGLLRGVPPAVADWTGDEVDDLIIGFGQDNVVTILPGGPAGLDRAKTITIHLDVMLRHDHGITVADFDGDGRLDLGLFGYTGEGTSAAYLWLRKDRP